MRLMSSTASDKAARLQYQYIVPSPPLWCVSFFGKKNRRVSVTLATLLKSQTSTTTEAMAGSNTARPVRKLARHRAKRLLFTPVVYGEPPGFSRQSGAAADVRGS